MPELIAPRELAALPLVEAGEGAELLLTLIRADGSRVSVPLGPAEATAVARDLLVAANARMGRAGWPQSADGCAEAPRQPGTGQSLGSAAAAALETHSRAADLGSSPHAADAGFAQPGARKVHHNAHKDH